MDRDQLLAEAREWIKFHPESKLANEDLEKMTEDEIQSQLDSERLSFGLEDLSSSEQPKEKEL